MTRWHPLATVTAIARRVGDDPAAELLRQSRRFRPHLPSDTVTAWGQRLCVDCGTMTEHLVCPSCAGSRLAQSLRCDVCGSLSPPSPDMLGEHHGDTPRGCRGTWEPV